MNKYRELQEKQQQESNSFPYMFAFDQKQFDESMRGLGLDPKDTDKIISIGYGGYIRKTDKDALLSMRVKHNKEVKDAIAADKDGTGYIFDMFEYELANHEYCITWDLDDTLSALGLTMDQVNSDPRMVKALRRAHKETREKEGM